MTTSTANQVDFEATLKGLQAHYSHARRRMLDLCEPLETEDFVVQTAPYVSPPKWHLGHTSWFFEVLLKRFNPNHDSLSKEFAYYLNSYYEGLGKRIDKSKRGTQPRPTVKATKNYRAAIDELVARFLKNAHQRPDKEEVLKQFNIGLEHENQHQELLLYDLKHILGERYQPKTKHPNPTLTNQPQKTFIEFPEGLVQIGADEHSQTFHADNEYSRHNVYLHPFALANTLVTVGDYLEFIHDGGYRDYRWWLSDGWTWVKRNKIDAPAYFIKHDDDWLLRDFSGLRQPTPTEPVAHVSYYEAAAFAKWKGCRLPTEMEWEAAATAEFGSRNRRILPWQGTEITDEHGNFMENFLWGPSPAGAFPKGQSPSGIHQLQGDLWEWTSSDYAPYPGFKTHFEEYNDKWFVNQKVLRGGSWATPKEQIRSTYRNFFYPQERWLCSGFRLAKTL